MASTQNRLINYRRALLPAVPSADPAASRDAMIEGGQGFLEFVLSQDLGPLWHHHLHTNGLLQTLPSNMIGALAEARRSAAAAYLTQQAALTGIDSLFDGEGIAYVVMKGAQVRERVYPDPSLRPSGDIDILVAAGDRQRASRLLIGAGYKAHVDLATISHEATFSLPPVDIDLHWDILRPGRTRLDMTAGFLARRQRINGFWGLSDSDILFLMLTHPAFAKYVCSPNMGLGRVADFLLWLQRSAIDWPSVLNLLDRAGLKTAAWTVLSWFRMLASRQMQPILDGWLENLRPGRLRADYLHYWLTHDLPSRWLDRPLPIQVGFTLFLHDSMRDALRALSGQWRARRKASNDALLLLGENNALGCAQGCPETGRG